MPLSRRSFLIASAAMAAGGTVLPLLRALAQSRYTADPFTLGVASGYPQPDGIMLWTRLAPDPLAGGGMPPHSATVAWEVAHDEHFRHIVRSGTTIAEPQFAHSVHVEVRGLEPAQWYWYRFHAGDATSASGRTRTAPAPGASGRLRFALASCQQYEQGYYAAYRHMAADDLDLVVHVGDYIYESSWGRGHVRAHEAGEPVTLAEYRNRYACYKGDADLKAAHAAFPWLVTWDDHEVNNDYAGNRSQWLDDVALFLKRRAAAYQAYYEHMPLPHWARPRGPDMRIYARASFGNLVMFHVLDGRQYRAPQPCPRPGRGGGHVVEECLERRDPRTYLGAQQEQWLYAGLSASRARWNVIAQQTLMAQLNRSTDGGQAFHTDGWDGYPAARANLLRHVRDSHVGNPLVIGGDMHTAVVADLKTDFDDPRGRIVATEFVATSVSSQGPRHERTEGWLAANPHIKYARGTRRGYTAFEVAPGRVLAQFRTLDDVKDPHSGIRTSAVFAVEDGHPGAERA